MENKNEESRVGITMNKREKNRKWYVVLLCGRERKTIREKNHTQKTKNKRIQKKGTQSDTSFRVTPQESSIPSSF